MLSELIFYGDGEMFGHVYSDGVHCWVVSVKLVFTVHHICKWVGLATSSITFDCTVRMLNGENTNLSKLAFSLQRRLTTCLTDLEMTPTHSLGATLKYIYLKGNSSHKHRKVFMFEILDVTVYSVIKWNI